MDRIAFREGYSETEESIIFPDGERRVILTKKIRFEENGEPYIVGIASDITDLKNAKTELESTNSKLNEVVSETKALADEAVASSKAKEEFIATMSHEIRTPLNGILVSSQLLEQEFDDMDEDQSELVQIISKSGNNLKKVIDEVLDFSKIAAGKMDLEEHRPEYF